MSHDFYSYRHGFISRNDGEGVACQYILGKNIKKLNLIDMCIRRGLTGPMLILVRLRLVCNFDNSNDTWG